jgi:hypothetical protein
VIDARKRGRLKRMLALQQARAIDDDDMEAILLLLSM